MTNKDKIIIGAIAILLAITSAIGITNLFKGDILGTVAYNTTPTFYIASSTAFTLTTASQRLLGTSTPTKRLAATVQPVNCTNANGGVIYMKASNDAPAVAATGIAAYGSTTFAFGDYPNTPVFQAGVQGITAVGTCTVLVTEWRSQY